MCLQVRNTSRNNVHIAKKDIPVYKIFTADAITAKVAQLCNRYQPGRHTVLRKEKLTLIPARAISAEALKWHVSTQNVTWGVIHALVPKKNRETRKEGYAMFQGVPRKLYISKKEIKADDDVVLAGYIPAGSLYVRGKNGDIVGTKMVVDPAKIYKMKNVDASLL